MSWVAVKLQRRQGIGAGRPTAPVRISLHKNGANSFSLRCSVSLEVIHKAGLREATGVHLEVNREQGLFRLAFRVSGPAKLRPGFGASVSWLMSCVHSGEMQRVFPSSMFREGGKGLTVALKLVEASSEGITVEIPRTEGGQA
jgi:hypothetical protein